MIVYIFICSRFWNSWPLTAVTVFRLLIAVKIVITRTKIKVLPFLLRLYPSYSRHVLLITFSFFFFFFFVDNDSMGSVSSAIQDSDQELTVKSK